MKKRDVLNSPRLSELKKKRRRVLLQKIFFVLLAIAVFVVPLAYISRMEKLNIGGVVVKGNKVIDPEILKDLAQERMSGSYLWIFPRTNLFLYPKNDIKESLTEKYKRIKEITLAVKDKKILEVSIVERIPKYLWCGTTPPPTTSTPTTCYFLDEDGYIFDLAPYFSGEVYFKFYGDTILNDGDPTGSYFFGANFTKFIAFRDALISMGTKPVAAFINEKGDINISLSSLGKAGVSPEILLKTNADFNHMAENLQTAISTEPLQTDFRKRYSSLLYIDLRYGNKVYYKFK
jgi:hypothetical protein